jgi:hypothetical protein
MSIPRPQDNAKCSGCHHSFGEHFTTYDGKKAGCSNFVDTQRDGGSCYCKGFALVWTPEVQDR